MKWNPCTAPAGEIGAWVGGRGRRVRRGVWGIGGWGRGTRISWRRGRRRGSGTRRRRRRGRRRWWRAQGSGTWGEGCRRRRKSATWGMWECRWCGRRRWGEEGPLVWFLGRLWLRLAGIAGFRGTLFGTLCNRSSWDCGWRCVSKKM